MHFCCFLKIGKDHDKWTGVLLVIVEWVMSMKSDEKQILSAKM